jgi:site-specific recombinase XerD
VRKTIAEYGPRRAKVRVFVETGGARNLVRVQWRVNGRLRSESYLNTPANRDLAKAFAQGLVEERNAPARPKNVTMRRLWELYSEAEFPHLRANSKRLYREYWSRWEAMWGRDFPVELTTIEMVHEFRRALSKLKLATSTIRQTIRTAKMVYAWGELNEIIEKNKLHLYKFKTAKSERQQSPDEFRDVEFVKILSKLDPESATQWRAYVALAICGSQGARQNAVLHLKWLDVPESIEAGGYVHWRQEWDKVGKDWKQPVRALTLKALAVARKWRERDEYQGEWILYSGSSKNRSEVYSAQSLNTALKGAEAKADITHKRGRGAHGFRRMLAGNVAQATGDMMLGLNAIGDTDPRMAVKYLKQRDDRMEKVFADLDDAEKAAEAAESSPKEST